MSGYIGVQPVPKATQRREYFTATNGQTSFSTSGYTPEYIDVYMNGVKLSPADFTATNGSDVVLGSGAATGDLLQIISFLPFSVLNQAFSGTLSVAGAVTAASGTLSGALGITQTGSVSTTPLSVHSNLNSGQAILELRSTGNSNSTIDLRADGTGDPKIQFDLNGASAFVMGVDNSDGNKFKISGHYQLETNPRLTIDSSGNLGLGETTPLDMLSISSSAGDAAIRLKRTDTAIVNDDIYGVINFAGDDSDSNASGIRGFIRGKAQGTGGGMKMEFHTAGGGAALVSNPRMTLNADGNLGLGTIVPSGKLSIEGGTATSEASHVTFTNTQGAKTYAVGAGQSGITNNGFVIRNVTDNNFPLVISDAGTAIFNNKVGIGGTPATNTKLLVKAGTNLNFEVENSSSNLRLSALNDARSANVGMQFASSAFEFLTGATTFNNNVAISASSGDTLTLTKSTTEPSLRIEGDANKDFVFTVSGELLTLTQNDGATDIVTFDHDTKAATFGGNVTVSGETRTTNINTASSTGTLVMYGGATNKGGTIELSGGNNTGATGSGIVFKTGASTSSPSERFRIDSAGLISAGPSGGGGNAIIAGSSSPSFTNQAGTNLLLKSGDGSGSGSSFMTFSTSEGGASGTTVRTAQERMRIDSSGNVGIGSSRTDRGLLNVNHDNTGDAFSGSHIALTYDVSPTNNDSKAGITYATSDSDNYGYFQGAERTTSGHGAFVLRYHHNSAGGTKVMEVNSNGAISKFLQPAFLAIPSSNQDNIASGSATTIVFGTEVFDQNADFSSNTFTAPVTGRYQLSANVYMSQIDTAATYYEASIRTSNRNYHNIIQPKFSSDPYYWSLPVNVLADMDAGDTAYVTIVQYDATQQTDVLTSSFFSGYLVA